VNGAVTATGLTGAAKLSTVNGSAEAQVSALKAPLSLKSVNGPVTIELPAAANADLSAETLTGGISTDFDLDVKKEFPLGQKLHDQIGTGGPAVKLSTVNGGIHINRAN
jgi:DUF4097 and DUF4098 domain-containing protein YvlB